MSLRRCGNASLRAQVEQALRTAIRTGRITDGVALPSTRQLAHDLQVSRGVIVEAYEQLLAEGYLTASRGSATRVAAPQRLPQPAGPVATPAPSLRYDFRPGLPDARTFPRRAWLTSLRRAVNAAPDSAFGYPDPAGAWPARAALAAYLNRARGTSATADRVVLCTGFAQGLRLVCQVLRERGVARVGVEDPGHAEQRADIAAMGLEIQPVPVDRDGLRADRLGRLQVGAILVTPAHQFPSGAVLGPRRRTALLDWASRRGTLVIEDDYDAEYRYDREPVGAMQGLAPAHVVYMGSASKTLAPALRLGWLVLPAGLAERVSQAKLHADHGSPVLEQLALADFIERGELDRHLRNSRRMYRRRRDALVAALQARLPQLRIHGVAAGLHLMLELPSGVDERAVVAAAARRSVGVYGVRCHRVRADGGPAAVLLGYGSLSETEVANGIDRLTAVLTHDVP